MSFHSEQNTHLSQSPEIPASGAETGSTSQQQPHESQAADAETGTTQDPLPPGAPFGKAYIARPSALLVDVNNKGEIVHQQRFWVPATSETIQNLPQTPPRGVRVGISNIGLDNETSKFILDSSTKMFPIGGDNIPYKIPGKEGLRKILESGLYALTGELTGEFASFLEKKSVARLNAHRLQELCQEGAVPAHNFFIAQSNIFVSSLPSRPFPDRSYMLHEQGFSSCRLQSPARTWYGGLGGFSLRFWETFSEVSIDRNENGSAEILFTFPALRLPSVPQTPDPKMVTPAQSSFETLLRSNRSSLRLLGLIEGDAELAIKLILLDSFRTSMESWENFLRTLTASRALPHSDSLGLTNYEKDLAYANEFSSLVRDLCSCVSFLTSSIALDYFTEKSKDLRWWDHLLLELRTSEAVLQNSVQQLLDIARPKFDMAVADSSASQATGLKRLTVIAVVFLPLSLASSLLTMTESVQKIGEHWFDWLGLWLTMGFVVALVYSLWKWIDRLVARPLAGVITWELLEDLQNLFFLWFVPLFCVIVVSFWIGMLDDLQTVPEALKWGFVAFAGLVASRLLWVILRDTYKASSYGLRKVRGKRRIHYFFMGCEFYFRLKRLGGTFGDMIYFYSTFVSPDAVKSLEISELKLQGLVERVLKAAARCKHMKRFMRAERAFFRQIIIEAEQREDQRVKEMVQEIRDFAAIDSQVQELLAGII